MSDHLNNYDVRLYETIDILKPCPYCKLERIVVEHHNEGYENPIEYTIEHVDEKAAVTAGCYDMYYAFDDLNFAIKRANSYGYGEDI